MNTLLCLALGLFAPGTFAADEVDVIATGFVYAEGPVTDAAGNLFFTDGRSGNGFIYRRDPFGRLSVFIPYSFRANGLTISPRGEFVACSPDGKIVAFSPDGKGYRVVADRFGHHRFNAPNDLTPDAHGGVYFTDPAFQAPRPLPQHVRAVYYVAPNGSVTRVTGDLDNPNGILLSRDQRTLFVVQSFSRDVLAYPVLAPGLLGHPYVFCKLQPSVNPIYPGGDGLAQDINGDLYIASQRGIQVYDAAGHFRRLIHVPERAANVAFSPDYTTLYITARHSVYATCIR